MLTGAAGLTTAPVAVEAPLDVTAMRRHIEYLASDALEGRGTPSPVGEAQVMAGFENL